MSLLWYAAAGLALQASVVLGAKWDENFHGQLAYVTRPDIRAQQLALTTYEPDLLSPGYFIVAPYDPGRSEEARHVAIPAQVGPHIYDVNGDLVWSGSYTVDQHNVYDLEVTQHEGQDVISFNVWNMKEQSTDPSTHKCTGMILNNHYDLVTTVKANNGTEFLNMHELRLIDDGNRALVIVTGQGETDDLTPDGKKFDGRFSNNGFQEVDVVTQEVLFEWWAHDHIPVTDSTHFLMENETYPDPYHMNSLDKTNDGNYLLSIRHMSAVYLVNGKTGAIMWQLGGRHSSFEHIGDVDFNYQHHARVYSRNATHTLITFLDNSSNKDMRPEGKHSSAVFISLDTVRMTATVLQRWYRPDENFSWRRGSVQVLENMNAFVGWGEWGYTSEFTQDGKLIQEVRYVEKRFDDYRTYKLPHFVGYSNEPIAVVSHVHGASADSVLTTAYVSWNGATEVARWNVYEEVTPGGGSRSATYYKLVGSQARTGFETTIMMPGYHENVIVEAVMANGTSMANSTVTPTKPPSHMSDAQRENLFSMAKENAATGPTDASAVDSSSSPKCPPSSQPASSTSVQPLVLCISAAIGLLVGAATTSLALFLMSRMHQQGATFWKSKKSWTQVKTVSSEDGRSSEDMEQSSQPFLPKA